MKLIKNLTLAAATLTLAACSTDLTPEKAAINSASGVTVEMGEAELIFPEDQTSSSTYYQIPIVVVGETNGAVEVTVEFGEIEASPAVYGENYVVTSNKVIIPAGSESGYIEFYPKGDTDENDDRQFTVTITKAEGAVIGTQKTTLVTLLDNEAMVKNAYANIQGTWTVSANSVFDGPYTYQMIVQGFEEGDSRYLNTVNLIGIGGEADFVVPATMSCNAVNGETTLTIATNENVLGTVVAGTVGLVDIRLIYLSDGYLYSSGDVTATSNAELTTITFNNDLYGAAFTSGSSSFNDYLGGWFYDEDTVMTKN